MFGFAQLKTGKIISDEVRKLKNSTAEKKAAKKKAVLTKSGDIELTTFSSRPANPAVDPETKKVLTDEQRQKKLA